MTSPLAKPFEQYAPERDVPLAGYALSMLTFTGLIGTVLVSLGKKSRTHAEPLDLALLGVATHKLSRIVTKDFVTSPLRAPFTERGENEGAGEVHDEPRGGQVRRTIGHLLTCPYCAGPWIATALNVWFAWKPDTARFALRMLSSVAVSDALHLAYSRLNESRKLVQAQKRLHEAA